MDAFVITLREGIEAALVIGVVIAFVAKAGRPQLARPALAGAAAAVLFSVAAAFGLQALRIDVESPAIEGVLYAAAGIAVASLVAWMLSSARDLRKGIESRLGALISANRGTRALSLSLFAFTFFMVAREGVETVLFLSALSLDEGTSLATTATAFAGIGAAVVFGYLFVRGAARLDLKMFFGLTGIVLLLLAVKLLASSVHEFEEAGVIPMSKAMAAFFDTAHDSNAVDWLFLAALAIPFAAPWLRRVRHIGAPADPTPAR